MRLGPCAMTGRLESAWSVSLPAPFPTAEAYVGGMLFCLGIFLSFYLLTVLPGLLGKLEVQWNR